MLTRHRTTGMLTAAIALLGAIATIATVFGTATAAHAATTTGALRAVHTAAAAPATKRHTVRPVTSAGRPARGWKVHKESGSVDCYGSSASAVDNRITACFPTAAYLPSCWKSKNHTVLCLRNPAVHQLVRIRYTGAYPKAKAPKVPSPQRLLLTSGSACLIRDGGAWGSAPGHPRWVGFYSCNGGAVFGPPSGNGINERRRPWRVHLVKNDQKTIVNRGVRKAVFVGTAA